MPPRLPPTTPADRDPETNELLEVLGGLNIFDVLAHHPKLLKRWLVFGGHVLGGSTLPEREREILILRTGWRCGSEYEFGQHTLIGREAGLSEAEIRALAAEGAAGFDDGDAALIAAADDLVRDHRLGDRTWEALAGRWDARQLLDIIFTVGQYALVSMVLNSLEVQREGGVPGFPT
jgi:alkylhydroperoxidase family enzyme